MTAHPQARLVQDWLDTYKTKTKAAYAADWRAFLSQLGVKRLENVDRKDITLFIESSMSQVIATRRKSALRSFYIYAQDYRLLDCNKLPLLQHVGSNGIAKLPALTQEELLTLFDATETMRERALISLLYGCPMTVDEARMLRWSDLNVRNGTIRISGPHARSVAPGDHVVAVLNGLRDDFVYDDPGSVIPATRVVADSDPILTNATRREVMSQRHVNRMITELGERAGLSVTAKTLFNAHIQNAFTEGEAMNDLMQRTGYSYKALHGHRRVAKGKAPG